MAISVACSRNQMFRRPPLFQRGTPVFSRRLVLIPMVSTIALEASNAGEVYGPSFRKSSSGLKIQDILEGSGQAASEGDLVEFNYVCRRSNGYYVYSTMDQFSKGSQPVLLALDKGQVISGLVEVIGGMRPGGKRRALIPPELGYTDPSLQPQPGDFGAQRSLMAHAREPLVFEIQLLRVK